MPDFATEADRRHYIISQADYFTAVVFMGVGRYERIECPTLDVAQAVAQRGADHMNKQFMIYAIRGTSDTLVETVKPKEKLGGANRGLHPNS